MLKEDSVEVRKVAGPEAELVRRVAAIEARTFGRGGLNEWHLPVFIRHGALFVAEVDGAIAGAAALMASWGNETAFIFDLAIDKRYRRRGCGRSLVAAIEEHAREEGVISIELTVAPGNAPALRLYESAGFKRQALYKDEYGKGEDRLLLRKELRR